MSEKTETLHELEKSLIQGKSTAISCIAGNIYGHLQEKGQEWLDAKKSE